MSLSLSISEEKTSINRSKKFAKNYLEITKSSIYGPMPKRLVNIASLFSKLGVKKSKVPINEYMYYIDYK
jgi:hypothetical protein